MKEKIIKNKENGITKHILPIDSFQQKKGKRVANENVKNFLTKWNKMTNYFKRHNSIDCLINSNNHWEINYLEWNVLNQWMIQYWKINDIDKDW